TGARPFTVSVSGDVTTTCALARPDSARPRHAAIIDRRNDVRDLRVRCMEFLRLVGLVARRPRPPDGTPDVGASGHADLDANAAALVGGLDEIGRRRGARDVDVSARPDGGLDFPLVLQRVGATTVAVARDVGG